MAVKPLSAEEKSFFKEYGKRFQSWIRTDGIPFLKEKRDHVKYIQEKLSKENLANIHDEEFINIFVKLWAIYRRRNKKWRAKDVLAKNSIKNIQLELSYLLHSDESIVKRFDKTKENLNGFGSVIISEILWCMFPEKYCLWNARSRDILADIGVGILPDNLYNRSVGNGDEYFECIQALNLIKKELEEYGVKDFVDLDTFFDFISYPQSSEDGVSYLIDDIIKDGCFLEKSELVTMIKILETKKNLILQGPPGTGKTWLAKRLAYALIGYKPDPGMDVVQFHPNFSYEDFVRGWRPVNNKGKSSLELVDGPFLNMIEDAKNYQDESNNKFVMVIEEINRGNPASIFGEMLTLLEADKRNPDEALMLSYPKSDDVDNDFVDDSVDDVDDGLVYIPENMYVIGTMNVADRSIAMMDLALRRRFGFYNLKPIFNKAWKDWVHNQCGIDIKTLDDIGNRLEELNNTIEQDTLLGPHFKVGHSYVTPNYEVDNPKEWFKQVVHSDIGPLLDEYWIEDPKKAKSEKDKLLRGFDS